MTSMRPLVLARGCLLFAGALALIIALLGLPARVLAQQADGLVPVPMLTSRVMDFTDTLSPQQRAALEANLAEFEARKGSQISILILPTTTPEAIEQYSIRVADTWKVGRRNVDDGIIIVVAKNDRRMRIEVGRGLEGAVPDAYAKRIISDIMTPRFREGDFYGGLRAATQTLEQLISGERLPAPTPRGPGGQGGGGFDFGYLVVLLVATMVIGAVLTAILGRFLGAAVTGGIVGSIAWVIAGLIVAGIGAGVLAFLFTLVFGGSHGGYTGGRRGPRGPVIVGPWGGGGWGGGGSGGGGGGWSGGGGGFSGGGASGSW
jgi:uncharacterized protein